MKKDVLVVTEHDLPPGVGPYRVRYERSHDDTERLVLFRAIGDKMTLYDEAVEILLDTIREGRALQGEFVDGEC